LGDVDREKSSRLVLKTLMGSGLRADPGAAASPCPGSRSLVSAPPSPAGSRVPASPHATIPAACNRRLSGKRVSSLACLIKQKTTAKG